MNVQQMITIKLPPYMKKLMMASEKCKKTVDLTANAMHTTTKGIATEIIVTL